MGGGAQVDMGRRRETYHHDVYVVMVGLGWVGYLCCCYQ